MYLSLALTLAAATSPPPDTATLDELGSSLRQLIRTSLPATLFEASPNWGNTTQVPHALHWHGRGLRVRPEIVRTARNDGMWRKIRVTTQDLDRTLELHLSDVKHVASDRITFNVFLAFQAAVDIEQQIWESGIRLYSGSARARLRVKLPLVCEATVRAENAKSLLPDLVLRLRVVKADLGYDNLVVEHIAGIGGTGGRWLGEVVRSTLHELRPGLERELLARANAAIVKAGDTREIRIGLSSLFEGKRR